MKKEPWRGAPETVTNWDAARYAATFALAAIPPPVCLANSSQRETTVRRILRAQVFTRFGIAEMLLTEALRHPPSEGKTRNPKFEMQNTYGS
jgi:hypothetical protein